ncbi:unnamed protein product [Cyprideis torosa]|uniref:Uncharacterized protein n=1 Tax=Cyprideis torosa TaxID=163714 RepID=A0A7R8ZKL1_9CRUS|nr:unnamed protein product [Cyprideis torosa]CAG0891242.1 unnamed protein product [Cyprideis torosa]
MGCPTIQGEELVTKVADEASKVTMEDKNGLVKRQGNKGDFYGYEYDYETTADTDPYLAVKYKNVAQTESYSPVPTYGYATRYKGNDLYGRYQKAPVPTDVYTTTQPSAKRLTYQAYHHQLPAYTSTGQENSMEVDQTTSSSIFRNMLSQVYKPKMIDRIGAAAAAMGSGILIPLIALGALLPFTLMPITITITPEQTRKKREVDQHFFPSPTLNSSWRFSADDLEAPVESTEWQDRIEMALQHFELVSHSLGIHPANLGGAILDDVMAKYLQCSGLLGAELGCLERMVCMQECYAQQLDRNDKKIIETMPATTTTPLAVSIVWLVCLVIPNSEETEICGGTFNESKGIIQTPNFPGSFSTPISCQYIMSAPPGHIVHLYLTQFYLREGVHAKSYAFYSEDFSMGEEDLGTVSAEYDLQFIESPKQFLVLIVNLPSLENVNIRVRDEFMDVYGFNITYEMKREGVHARKDGCNAQSCSFNGNCYAINDYRRYACDCFAGFFGSKCQFGPRCDPERNIEICQHGGRCQYFRGSHYIRCTCPPGYTGELCETPFQDGILVECIRRGFHCSQHCLQEAEGEEIKYMCSCYDGFKLSADNVTCLESGETRFITSFKLTDFSLQSAAIVNEQTLNHMLLREKIVNEVQRYLGSMLDPGELKNVSVISIEPGAVVTIRFIADRASSDIIRIALMKAIDFGTLGSLTLSHNYVYFEREPILKLQSVELDQELPIRYGLDVVISCVAVASNDVEFEWSKDGCPIDINHAYRNASIELMPKNSFDEFTSKLTLYNISHVDAGLFTCKVNDWNRTHERSVLLVTAGPPRVELNPRAVSAAPDTNVTLTCIAEEDKSGRYGYTWSHRFKIVNERDPKIVIEDIYPSGSKLISINVTGRTTYGCKVTNDYGSTELLARVEVWWDDLPTCLKDKKNPLIKWPETTTNNYARVPCPPPFVEGYASRYCVVTNSISNWHEPNFEECRTLKLEMLERHLNNFRMGYVTVKRPAFFKILNEEVKNVSIHFSGQGQQVISLLHQTVEYLQDFGLWSPLNKSTPAIFELASHLLRSPIAITKPKSALSLASILNTISINLVAYQNSVIDYYNSEFAVYGEQLEESYGERKFVYPRSQDLERRPVWIEGGLILTLDHTNDKAFSVTFYKNLTAFIPKVSVIRGGDGPAEMSYTISSLIVTISLTDINAMNQTLRDDFGHLIFEISFAARDKRFNNTLIWEWYCGETDSSTNDHGIPTWKPSEYCYGNLSHQFASCTCSQPGTYAILFSDWKKHIIPPFEWGFDLPVTVSCLIAMLFSVPSALIATIVAFKHRSAMAWNKANDSSAIALLHFVFMMSARSSLLPQHYSYCLIALVFLWTLSLSLQMVRPMMTYVGSNTQAIQGSVTHRKNKLIGIAWGLSLLITGAAMAAQDTQGWDIDMFFLTPIMLSFYPVTASYALIWLISWWFYFTAFVALRRICERGNSPPQAKALTHAKALRCGIPIQLSCTAAFVVSIYFAMHRTEWKFKILLGVFFVIQAILVFLFYVWINEYEIPLWRKIWSHRETSKTFVTKGTETAGGDVSFDDEEVKQFIDDTRREELSTEESVQQPNLFPDVLNPSGPPAFVWRAVYAFFHPLPPVIVLGEQRTYMAACRDEGEGGRSR